jgi:hypothetical protein
MGAGWLRTVVHMIRYAPQDQRNGMAKSNMRATLSIIDWALN